MSQWNPPNSYSNLNEYRTVTKLFEEFIDETLCFIGDDIWKEIKNYFKNNVSTLESELKKYREIDDFNKITVYDVLIQKKNEIDIDKISRDFRNYVNNRNNNGYEKFINKNIRRCKRNVGN